MSKKEIRNLLSKYARFLVEEGSDSESAKKLLKEQASNTEFLELAKLSRLLHIGLGTKLGEGNKLDHSEPVDGDNDPNYRRWRVMVSLRHVGETGIGVWVSGRPAREQIYIPFEDLPKEVFDLIDEDSASGPSHLEGSDRLRLFAQANFGHPDPTKIVFSDWEIP